jgi:holo-[acyl-carrier protein] synthase
MSWPSTGRGHAREGGPLISVGVDIVDIDRFRRVLARRPAMHSRLFTAGELDYARTARDDVPRLAARFAAKEAVMKALGVGLGAFSFQDVEVTRHSTGAPTLVVRGGAERLATERGVARWHLSLSHTDHLATAVAVAE